MTDRRSSPSSGLGIDRFYIWPEGSDSYDHAQNAANWDMADAFIGVPSAGDWPPTTGIDGGIYREVKLLENERSPIGTVISWFRPDHATPIPNLWHVCDGSTLTSSYHDFPGGGSVTLPDLRNKFVLGADDTTANGTAAVAVSSGNINAAAGAPGAQATGGSNKIVQTISQLAQHVHNFSGHALPVHSHYTISVIDGFTLNHAVTWIHTFQNGGSTRGINNMGGLSGATSSLGSNNPETGLDSAGTPDGDISSVGSSSPMDNRPNWIGLIFLVKVLYSTTP